MAVRMQSHDYAGNCFGYLWWSLVFGLSISVLTSFYVPIFEESSLLDQDYHLDERALHILGSLLTLPTCAFIFIACCKMIKADQAPARDAHRRRFLLSIFIGVVIFALGTVSNVFIHLMAEVQLHIKSKENPIPNCVDTAASSERQSMGECNCISYWIILHRVTEFLFVILQTVFICLCAIKHLEPSWWLKLLLANLLVIDIYLALWSLIYKFTSEHSQSDPAPPLFPDFPGVPASHQDACTKQSNRLFLYKIRRNSIKWLYPLQSEFFLCAGGLLLNFWFHVQKPREAGGRPGEESLEHIFDGYGTNIRSADRRRRVMARTVCSGSVIFGIIGACVGMAFFVLSLVQGLVESEDCKDTLNLTVLSSGNVSRNGTFDISTRDAMVWHSSQWIVYRTITITTTVIILFDLFCCHKRRQGHIGVDTWVLGVFLPAVIVFQLTQLIASAYLRPTECSPRIHGQLTMTSSVMAVVDALLQTGLVFCGSHFAANHAGLHNRLQRQDVEESGLLGHVDGARDRQACTARHLLLFLAACDLAMWLVRSFEALNKQMRTFSAPAVYYGKDVWHNIVSFLFPILALFYFHSFACLLELFFLLRPRNEAA